MKSLNYACGALLLIMIVVAAAAPYAIDAVWGTHLVERMNADAAKQRFR